MKRVLDSGILRVVIALVLVAILIAGGWLSELNPIFLQIFVALISASGAIVAAYISRSQAQKKRNGKVRSARVKGYSKTENELLKMYQSKLRGDPRIAHVKILDMNRLLEIKNIYVQVKIHQETRLTFEPDATFHDSAFRIESDPTRILKANRSRIESRANVALDAIGVIGKNKHCVIVGDPGTGKTTLLKYLTLKSIRAIKEQTSNQSTLPIFPIYIELNAFASSDHEKLLEYAASLWNKRYNIAASYDVIMPLIEHRLAEGEALILLDGLDETLMGGTKEEAEKKYSRVVDAITNLSTSYTESSIVVTVRKAVYYQQKRRLDGFTEYEMQEFRSEDIKQLVHNWFAATPDPQRPCNAYDLLD
ncbi:MAG TPA: NACHT domain-containing protein, partial [Ktedonobacteraceae bacterium]|nr:NACHT domain-containing protein [Ktedonobacteraceae bacterium]